MLLYTNRHRCYRVILLKCYLTYFLLTRFLQQDEMEYELEWLFVDEGGEGLVVKEGRRVNLLKECYDMFKVSF